MKTTLQILTEARETLSEPSRWTKGWFAFDAKGEEVWAKDDSAVCFCMYGAVDRSADTLAGKVAAEDVLIRAIQNTYSLRFGAISDFNDYKGRTHKDILNVLDKAITYEKESTK